MVTVPAAATQPRSRSATPAGSAWRVLMVSYHFPPSELIGAQAAAQIARYLPEYGWEPVVLTAVEDRYFEERDPATVVPFRGSVVRTRVIPHPLELYRCLRSADAMDRAGAASALGSRGGRLARMKRWALALLSIPDTLTGWVPVAVFRGYRLIRSERISSILSTAPCWTNHLVGLALKWLTGLPWTAHFRDPWTELKAQYPLGVTSPTSLALERRLERLVVQHADWVVCVTERHTASMRRAHPDLPATKFVTIPNGYAPDEFTDLLTRRPDPTRDGPEQFVITYVGTVYEWRNLDSLFLAVRRLIDAHEVAADGIVVNVVGIRDAAHDRQVTEAARGVGLGRVVRLRGVVTRPVALAFMVHSDLLVLFDQFLDLQVPGKTYEYLRAGRPILALASEGAAADLVRAAGGGYVVAPDDVGRIVTIVGELIRRKQAGVAVDGPDPALVGRFDRRALTRQFASLLGRSPSRAVA